VADNTKKVKKVLSNNGCYFVRHGGRGDHDIWHSPISKRNFVVDGAINNKPLANKIMKQAGINHKF
jgi:predicted RNA binding protein YcfA (HicA-like mRNA interferase family)